MSAGNESERLVANVAWVVAGLRERAAQADGRGDSRMARGDLDDAGDWYERARIARWIATGIETGTVTDSLQHQENLAVIAAAGARTGATA